MTKDMGTMVEQGKTPKLGIGRNEDRMGGEEPNSREYVDEGGENPDDQRKVEDRLMGWCGL